MRTKQDDASIRIDIPSDEDLFADEPEVVELDEDCKIQRKDAKAKSVETAPEILLAYLNEHADNITVSLVAQYIYSKISGKVDYVLINRDKVEASEDDIREKIDEIWRANRDD